MDYSAAYSELHKREKYFQGFTMLDHIEAIKALIEKHNSQRLLDYGCGKGRQYTLKKAHEKWGGLMPVLYDPGVPEFSEKPRHKFDGIICTDVMEHIDEPDIKNILDDIFDYAADEAFVFFNISCRPAKRKKLPDGRNVHLTVKPPEWWDNVLSGYNRNGLDIVVAYEQKDIG